MAAFVRFLTCLAWVVVCMRQVQAQTGTNANFFLADNGMTVMCPDAIVGETGLVNGVSYTKRIKEQIDNANAPTTCTSGITDMSKLFQDTSFDGDISSWDTSQVTDMSSMFEAADSFNQNISVWDTSNVVNMTRMFKEASSFNQDIMEWDTRGVVNMTQMLEQANNFNQDIVDAKSHSFLIRRYLSSRNGSFDSGFQNHGKTSTMIDPGKYFKAWNSCIACIDEIGGKASFCEGVSQTDAYIDIFSGKQSITCDTCRRCPNCEGCFIYASPYKPDFFGARKKKMMLYTMRDSKYRKYLVKVTPSPPTWNSICLNKIVDECGFQDIVVHEREGPLFAKIMNNLEQHTIAASKAIFSEMGEGEWRQSHDPGVLTYFNGSQIVRAALFQFLFGSGDGLWKNVVFQTDSGNLLLIDNLEDGLCNGCKHPWGSIFYPGNLKFYGHSGPNGTLDLSNYQKRLHGGILGKNYDGHLMNCLHTIAARTTDDLAEHYALKNHEDAYRLKERAIWMLDGFENAIWKQFCKYYSPMVPKFLKSYGKKRSKEEVERMKIFLHDLDGQRC